jgi:hypothetical protein
MTTETLKPTLDLVAPLMGRSHEHQKRHWPNLDENPLPVEHPHHREPTPTHN